MKSGIEKVWITKEGYKAVVLFNTDSGFRCGYVAIPNKHKAFGVGIRTYDVEVHGGLSYAQKDNKYPIETDESLYWFGFDCGHAYDNADWNTWKELCETHGDFDQFEYTSKHSFDTNYGHIRDLNYVVQNCNKLSKQLFDIDKLKE